MDANQNGDFIKCAICEVTYGIRFGDMPNGTMHWSMSNNALPGFPGTKTINFGYNFPSGIKADGTRYSGTSRGAYLPTSPDGIIAFKMMVTAF